MSDRLTFDHLVDLSAGELANGVGDGDVGGAARGLLGGSDLQDTVDIDLENTLKSGLASAHGRDRSQSELAEGGVVGTVGTLTLEDRELDGGLVVHNSGESALLDGRHGLSAGHDGGEDVALHGDTKRKGNDIEEQQILSLSRRGLARKDTSLHSSAVSDSLVGVDALHED